MSTINEITSKQNRRSWWNDIKQELITDFYYDNLPENFEAIILSGQPEQHNSPEELKAFGTEFEEQNDNRYFFVRIMPIKTQGAILPDPFLADNLQNAKRLINAYPLAYIAVSEAGRPPTHGDVYQCRYTNNDRRGIALVKRLRNSGKKIGLISNREIHKGFRGMGSPTLIMDSGAPNFPPGPQLGQGWLPGDTLVDCFGYQIPCSKLVNFDRDFQVDYFAYGKNPAPSEATDDLFWQMVCQKLGTNVTANKVRLFRSWNAKESSESTNNPFATMYPGADRKWSKDPNMTAYNYHKPNSKWPNGYAWVKNFSTMDAGALAVASTIKNKHYPTIRAKLMESDPQFPDSWFEQSRIKYEFETWGGRKEGRVSTYWKGVRDGYKNHRRRKKPINTNRPGGRSWRCVKK